MRISNKLLRLGVAFGAGFGGLLRADDLTLAGGTARLSGTVRSISESGVVELASSLSPEPLLLTGGAVEKISFSLAGEVSEPPGSMIELANGDLLPAGIDGLDAAKLTVNSPATGRMEIPRESLKSMQLGIRQIRTIYSGPTSATDWPNVDGGGKGWEFKRSGLISDGRARASKNFDLPKRFILQFTMKWEANPNFQISFADPLTGEGAEAIDRYYLQFGAAGLEVKRESSQGRRFVPVVQLNRTPDLYSNRQLTVEIRVDREASRLQLYLNGEPEGTFVDVQSNPPAGSGVVLISSAQEGMTQEIRDIEIREYDDARRRHRSEERGDQKTDSMISRDDERWGGALLDIKPSREGLLFRFKSDFQEEPLEIPAAEISTIFFAASGDQPAVSDKQAYTLRLRDGGSLRVSSCRFADDGVNASHPLLGLLKVRRESIASIEWSGSTTKPAPKS